MLKSRNSLLAVLFALVVLCLAFAEAAPQRNANNGNGNNGNGNNGNGNNGNGKNKNGNGGNGGKNGGQKLTAQEKAAQKPGGISTAKDGSTTLDMTVQIK